MVSDNSKGGLILPSYPQTLRTATCHQVVQHWAPVTSPMAISGPPGLDATTSITDTAAFITDTSWGPSQYRPLTDPLLYHFSWCSRTPTHTRLLHTWLRVPATELPWQQGAAQWLCLRGDRGKWSALGTHRVCCDLHCKTQQGSQCLGFRFIQKMSVLLLIQHKFPHLKTWGTPESKAWLA